MPPCVKNLYSKMPTHECDGSLFGCLGLIKQMDEVGALAHAGVTLDEVIHALSCVAARVSKEEDTRKGDVTGIHTKKTKSKMIQISNQDYDERRRDPRSGGTSAPAQPQNRYTKNMTTGWLAQRLH